MKKILILSLLALTLLTVRSFAQQNALVAVLTHDGTNSTFHGAGALAEANEAALDGDVITLSGGTFNEVTVSKGITIRGAGMYRNDSTDVDETQVTTLTIADSTNNVCIENLYLPTLISGIALVHNIFYKTRFSAPIDINEGSETSFINCKIPHMINCNGKSKVAVFNSIVYRPNVTTDDGIFNLQNCVIVYHSAQSSRGWIRPESQKYMSFENCIIVNRIDTRFPSTITAYHNIGYSGDGLLFNNITNSTNITLNSQDQILAMFRIQPNVYFDYDNSLTFELTDEAAATYLGSDGTQVGIYGGLYPFDSNPHHPIITKSNVARRAADGKLHVSFEVNGNE